MTLIIESKWSNFLRLASHMKYKSNLSSHIPTNPLIKLLTCIYSYQLGEVIGTGSFG